jgi:hypothetical protein
LYQHDARTLETLGNSDYFDRHPSWHPDGERIVFSSDRGTTGFDLWEIDVPTGLAWRLTSLAGDETEPAWSSDGRDLVYIHHDAGIWSVMLRRYGEPDRVLESSSTRLSSPAWRPDGSLVTILRHDASAYSIDMIILARPVLMRPLLTGEDFFEAPIAWIDRHQLIYAANGEIRTRLFNAFSSTSIPFRASVAPLKKSPPKRTAARRLPKQALPTGRRVIRVGRLFDGLDAQYRQAVDILIDGGRIEAIESTRERPGQIVVDLGNVTAVPGLIDVRASLPDRSDPALGPLLLSFGVTTIVVERADAPELEQLWSGASIPGPRVLGKDWLPELDAAASLVLSRDALPVSPQGKRYEDFRIDGREEPAAVYSGLADSRTPGLEQLLESRQAVLLDRIPTSLRRYVEQPRLTAASAAIVLGSRTNGLPPGIAQHAELLALVGAGLAPGQALKSAGVNAATALGVPLALGRIAPGAAADFVLLDGDPLATIADARNVVAVVRNGRFFSAIGLIELAQAAAGVE